MASRVGAYAGLPARAHLQPSANVAKTLPPRAFALLRLLADGELHSGENLARSLAMTRARVSQLLREAAATGLPIESRRGVGYRLSRRVSFLDAATVRTALAHGHALSIEVVDSIDSTNSELLRRASEEDVHGVLLAAEAQTAGRGRRGRAWLSTPGASLTFSLAWRFERGVGSLSGLSLAVGVAIARALEARGCEGIGLKWPNDLVHGMRKLGGILIEVSGDALGPSLAVVGVGLNVTLPETLAAGIAQPVADVASMSATAAGDRNALLAASAGALATVLATYAQDGFAPFRGEWQRRHAMQNEPVALALPDGTTVFGRALGVDAEGALVVDVGGLRRRFITGDVSLRACG